MDEVVRQPRLPQMVATIIVAAVLCWFVYVPLHELFHAFGCLASGGSVSELQIQKVYGGAQLAKIFPFVVTGGDYAGRLSGFDTHGSDFIHLFTTFAPYLLTVGIGVPLVQRARRAPLLLGPAAVVGLAPFYSLHGDYYEMGSILTTRVASWVTGEGSAKILHAARAEDVTMLLGRLFSEPQDLGLHGPGDTAFALGMILLSLAVGLLLALITYRLGRIAPFGPQANASSSKQPL